MDVTRSEVTAEAEFAWPGGDRPGRLDFAFQPAEPVQRAIRHALDGVFTPARNPDLRLASLQSGAGPVGRYRLTTPDGAWFVRVTSRWGRPELESAIAEFLVREGVSANPILVAGAPLQWGAQMFRVDVQPLIEGGHFDGSLAELETVAALLSNCHRALRRSPRRDEVFDAAASRNDRLMDLRSTLSGWLTAGKFDELCEYAEWASAHHEWLKELIDGFDPRIDQRPNAQCLHGEVHQGNVLFRTADHAPVLIDMEEAVHVAAPPEWDIAFLIQRFVLADNPSSPILLERLARVTAGYGAPLPAVAHTMRQIAWFNIAVILDLRFTHGVVTPLAECEKFVTLERQAAAHHSVL